MIRRILVLLLAAVAGWAGAAGASGFQTFEFSAAHIGQATAGMTSAENAAVVATLPAAMVRIAGDGASLLGVTQYDPSYSAEIPGGPPGTSAETQTSEILAPHAYYVHNRQQWAAGVGLYFPYNVVIEWPDPWYLDDAVIKEELVTQYLSFSGAYAANDDLSFGASLIYITATANLRRAQDLPSPPFPAGTEAPLELDVEADEIGYNASALWDTGGLAVGLNYNLGYTIEGDGTLTIGAPLSQSGPAKASLDIPATAELGLSYRNRRDDPDWRVELDLLHTSWSDFKEIRITSTVADDTIEKDWEDTLGIKLGGYYVVARSGGTSHRVRAGIFIDESPIPARTLAPDVPDGEGRQEWAVGYGLKAGDLIFDLAYFQVDFDDSTTGPDNDITQGAGGLPTQFGGEVTIISASVGYQY